jgi:hypothetical protein
MTAWPNLKQDKPHTDWLAWSQQMALGLVVGCGANFPIDRLVANLSTMHGRWSSGIFGSSGNIWLILIGSFE